MVLYALKCTRNKYFSANMFINHMQEKQRQLLIISHDNGLLLVDRWLSNSFSFLLYETRIVELSYRLESKLVLN